MRLRLLVVGLFSLSAFMGVAAVGPPPVRATCGDVCIVLPPTFDVLRADIATNAPTRLVRLFTFEANLSEALHPPSPCTPGSCVASQVVLIVLDLQVRGLPTRGSFTPTNAYVLDHDIRGLLTNPDLYPLGLQLLPPGPPMTPPGLPGPA